MTSETSDIRRKTICIVSFTLKKDGKRIGITIFPYQLMDYLRIRYSKVVFIEQPFSVSEDLRPTMEIWQDGRLSRSFVFPLPVSLARRRRPAEKPDVWLRIRDIASLLYFSTKLDGKIDLFVGWDFLNCLFGIFLRGVGMVEKVAYVPGDYAPTRFSNPLMNGVFHSMDKLCARLSDQVWDYTPMAISYRAVRPKKSVLLTLAVPEVGNLADKEPFSVVYIGNLFPKFGVQVLVNSFDRVLEVLPEARLHLIGEGFLRNELEAYVKTNGLDRNIIIHGRLSDEQADRILASSKIGVAPYLIIDSNSQFIWAEPSKVKVYLAHTLPVVVTRAAASARYVEEANAGLIINCNEDEIARAIVRLLTDQKLYDLCVEGAALLRERFKPERVFSALEVDAFS